MRANKLTEPTKKKCECGGDLPNTMFAPALKSTVTNKEICVDCKASEIMDALLSGL